MEVRGSKIYFNTWAVFNDSAKQREDVDFNIIALLQICFGISPAQHLDIKVSQE